MRNQELTQIATEREAMRATDIGRDGCPPRKPFPFAQSAIAVSALSVCTPDHTLQLRRTQRHGCVCLIEYPSKRDKAVDLAVEADVAGAVTRRGEPVGVLGALVTQRVVACGQHRCREQVREVRGKNGEARQSLNWSASEIQLRTTATAIGER